MNENTGYFFMDYKALAEYLFSTITGTIQELEEKYPPRNLPEGAKVTRIAPSPTGFMHLGNLYGAIADERLAHQSEGVFFLRIEDTDQKREVSGGVETILKVFDMYQLPFDEGVTAQGEHGAYGPYRQRQRAGIYHICTKFLLERGLAYPCFLTEQELVEMHDYQAKNKLNYGCYGKFAKYRDLPLEEIKERIAAGEPYVIRFRSSGNSENKIKATDLLRGILELPENDQDVVLLKRDGIPTYHFAHVVDDHFMRTTHVIRGEEWLATYPIHIQLFAAMGWRAPKFMHTAQLMKMDGDSKRKLSKRKDPELALDFYSEKGYTVDSVKEYLLSLLNSNFEDWRIANPTLPMNDFPFSIKKMGISGALFDINKLDDVSRNVISRYTPQQVYDKVLSWAQQYQTELATELKKDKEYAIQIFSIGRGGAKPRKDITYWSDVQNYIAYFYDCWFTPSFDYPQNVNELQLIEILAYELENYNPTDDSAEWFNKIKQLTDKIGFASNMKEYKKNPEAFGGNVGDVSMVIRVALTGRQQSMDLYEVMQILGEEKVKERLGRAIAKLQNK